MLKMSIDEFLEEIKSEIMGYEELGEEKAIYWEEQFRQWLNKPKAKKSWIKEINGKMMVVLEDEAELFKIVDQYLAAVDAEEENKYWEDWK